MQLADRNTAAQKAAAKCQGVSHFQPVYVGNPAAVSSAVNGSKVACDKKLVNRMFGKLVSNCPIVVRSSCLRPSLTREMMT